MNKQRNLERQNRRIPSLIAIFCGLYLLLIAAGCSGNEPVITPVSTLESDPNESSTSTETEETSWVILDDRFDNADQVAVGAEIYRLVCSACHGDVGQGFTKEWVAKWAPEDQNCWQSKCHAENHPPDGFVLPAHSPAVKGPIISALFNTALDLYQYNKLHMPWHAPGSMRDEEYWQLTAFLLDLNGIDLGNTILDADNAAGISLSK